MPVVKTLVVSHFEIYSCYTDGKCDKMKVTIKLEYL